ncbi:MAG: hypothetical protein KME06_09480 [Kastovskya adunca ATA6-11-RM4]|jgi:hypothetical protein|nr:hypothetical protein [Kastovskya adunca ATA6-11-RM4]
MARVNFSSPQLTPPAWAGDFLDRHSLIPGGARINPADFAADVEGRKPIKSGTLLGRTFAERTAGTGFGVAAATDEEIYLLAFDVTDAVFCADCELYRHNSLVKENFLPDWATMATALKDKIRALYQTTTGVV